MDDRYGNTFQAGQNEPRSRRVVARSASEALRPEPGPPPPRRSRQSRNRFVILLNFLMSLLVVGMIGVGGGLYLGKREFERPGPSTRTETVMVRPSTSLREIADLLERRGLITNSRIFQIGVRAHGNAGTLKAGEYEVRAGASMHSIMELMKSGRSVLYSLTVPEGVTVHEVMRRVAENKELVGEMPEEYPPEGWIIADTQRFSRGTTRRELIEKMVADQKRLVESIWARRRPDLPIKDINEFVTLASIVEKETGRADERTRVAAVFINRLRKGMRLQSDPTVIYAAYGGAGKPADKPIYRSDLDRDSPYNTYLNAGLPPTPIANPGRAALEAVANPSQTDEYYFVADGTGGHAFARTLEEHRRNVARWRQIEAERRRAAGQAAPDADGEAR